IALPSTVRHGSRLSFWKTKPRSPPGLVTGLPSIVTRPAVAGSRPAMMRRKVVLPQPLGPTSEMNSPGATERSIARSASSVSNRLSRAETASLAVIRSPCSVARPRHELAFEPAEPRRHGDAGDRQHDHAGEQLGHVERIRRLADQTAEPGARAEQLG